MRRAGGIVAQSLRAEATAERLRAALLDCESISGGYRAAIGMSAGASSRCFVSPPPPPRISWDDLAVMHPVVLASSADSAAAPGGTLHCAAAGSRSTPKGAALRGASGRCGRGGQGVCWRAAWGDCIPRPRTREGCACLWRSIRYCDDCERQSPAGWLSVIPPTPARGAGYDCASCATWGRE